jgi:hypothetical protein
VLENSFLKFNLQTDRTGLTALSTVSPKNSLFLRLSSQGSGMYFYNYDEQTYAFQSLLASISSAVGYLALLMMVLGCLVPAGKLIMLEALAVVQISFFTLMQFKKNPTDVLRTQKSHLQQWLQQSKLIANRWNNDWTKHL